MVNYNYDAWGNHKVLKPNGTENLDSSAIGNINPIRYRGYYYDIESGMYYLQSRYYDPTIGQFISPDSPKYIDPESLGGLNLYTYCGNNPVMYVDPTGYVVISVTAILVAAFIGAVIGGLVGGAMGAVSASEQGKDVKKGFWTGFAGGAIMGAAAGIASVFIAPVLAGASAVAATGLTFSVSGSTALAIGISVAFAGGAIGGGITEAFSQIGNTGSVYDVGSIIYSSIQYGILNVGNAFLSGAVEMLSILKTGAHLRVLYGTMNTLGMGYLFGLLGLSLDMIKFHYEKSKLNW